MKARVPQNSRSGSTKRKSRSSIIGTAVSQAQLDERTINAESTCIAMGMKYLQPVFAKKAKEITAEQIIEELELPEGTELTHDEFVEGIKTIFLREYYEDVEHDCQGQEAVVERVKLLIAINELKQISSGILEHYFKNRDNDRQYSGHEDTKKLLYDYFKQTLASGKAKEVKKGWPEYIRNIRNVENESADIVKRHIMQRIRTLHSYGLLEGILEENNRYRSGEKHKTLLKQEIGKESGEYLANVLAGLRLTIKAEINSEASIPKEIREKPELSEHGAFVDFLRKFQNPDTGLANDLMKIGTQTYSEVGVLDNLEEFKIDNVGMLYLLIIYENIMKEYREIMASSIQTIERYNLWESAMFCTKEEFEGKISVKKIKNMATNLVILRKIQDSLSEVAEEVVGQGDRKSQEIKRFNDAFMKHGLGDHTIIDYGLLLFKTNLLEGTEMSEPLRKIMEESLGAPPIKPRDKLLDVYTEETQIGSQAKASKKTEQEKVRLVKRALADLQLDASLKGMLFPVLEKGEEEMRRVVVEGVMQGRIPVGNWRRS
ncbi:MAG: hypothetical protein FWC68_00715 [Oscillospiraceae bacterium]|nr:hypothetical protein [Oscillospiraceae bacterium]